MTNKFRDRAALMAMQGMLASGDIIRYRVVGETNE